MLQLTLDIIRLSCLLASVRTMSNNGIDLKIEWEIALQKCIESLNTNKMRMHVEQMKLCVTTTAEETYVSWESVKEEMVTVVEDDIETLLARDVIALIKPPPAGYVCHLCFKPGHLKKLCPKIKEKGPGKTPYQGNRRCLGEFVCARCKRKWRSYCSWADCPQKCVKCKLDVYPFKQRPLNDIVTPTSEKPKKHPCHLCKRCEELGGNCGRADCESSVAPLRKYINFESKLGI